MSLKTIVHVDEFTPLRNHVFVTELESGMAKTAGGVLLTDDNMKEHGIRPRWGKVYAIGPEVENLKVGEWILTEHGRWTERIVLTNSNEETIHVWRVDYPNAVMLASDEDPRLNKPTVL